MRKNIILELEAQGAVNAFLTSGNSNERKSFQETSGNAQLSVYAKLNAEARRIIQESKTSMARRERLALSEFGDDSITTLDSSEPISEEQALAIEIETLSAVQAFFERGDTRGTLFLDSESFFNAYSMICESAKQTLQEERRHSIRRAEFAAAHFVGESVSTLDYLEPTDPIIETEVSAAMRYILSHDKEKFVGLGEESFFRAYSLESSMARREVVEQRQLAEQNITAADLFINEEPQKQSEAAKLFL